MRHNKWRVELSHVIVAIPFGLDAIAFNNNKHNKPNNLQHPVLLVVLVEARVAGLAEQPLIFNVLNDVLVLNTRIAIDIKLVFNVLLIVINLDDALDFEHTNQ
jgi:hypothetical protein